jgi:hypothetical protein
LPGIALADRIELVSRADPGDLSLGRLTLRRRSMESLGADWLYAEQTPPLPSRWRALVHGRFVLSTLGGLDSLTHHRLGMLQPLALVSVDPRPRDDSRLHITEQWAEQVRLQPVRAASLDGHDVRVFRDHTPGETPVVVVHPGSGAREKCWPLTGFVELGRHCLKAGFHVVFVLGEAEHDRWSRKQIEQIAGNFATRDMPRPKEFVELLASAHAFVGNDSGPTHLAALVGTPVVALFGPTEPHVWRPLGRSVRVVRGTPSAEGGLWGLAPANVARVVNSVAARRSRT